jgi:uncharacterized membrane protein YecN with MAPEG domain
MPLPIVSLYAGINGLIALALAVRVVRQRSKTGTSLGSGGHAALEQAIRVHGNFIEYVPLVLILLALLELDGTPALRLHVLGAALTLGRILHAWGLSSKPGLSFGRSAGIALTWATLLAAAISTLLAGLRAL